MPTKLDGLGQVEVTSRAKWRSWLKRNHARSAGIWLVTWKIHRAERYVSYEAVVEEALCFGWIDSVPRKLDADRRMQYFCPRKPKSVWSKLNKERIEKLIATKRMTAAGLKKIGIAKQNGSWTSIDAAEAFEMPADLLRALRKNKKALSHYEAFPPGARKQILTWVLGARTGQTRDKRIAISVELAARNIRANGQTVKALASKDLG
ncbi:MAG: YdeI/OmpD-associated family protein [Flavobacteriales bacterium]|nr:YdeI/OmpD-associated family protein [Flavobacteriales bacterium]